MALTQVKTLGIAADAVTGAKVADDAIDSEHYTNASIDHAHLANDCVDGDNLADNACDSEHYTDGSIDAVHLSDDSVATAKVQDNAVTLAKMAGLARGKLIYGDSSGNPAALTVGSANQVLTADGTDVAWAAAAGGGKLLQVVGNDASTHTTINTTTKTSTGLLQSITPTKTGSKMIFMCAGHYSQNTGTGSHGPQVIVSIYKQIGSGTDTEIHQVTYDYIGEVASVYYSHHFAATYFDPTATLNTTDAIKYTIYAKMLNADHAMRFNPSGRTSLIVMEYDA